MTKVDKSQVIILSILLLLLVMTPFLPSSMKPSYLYLIFNILIIALGVEAGFLSVFSDTLEDKKQQHEKETSSCGINNACSVSEQQQNQKKVFEKCVSEKIVFVDANKVDHKVKKCASMPSLFYIEDHESEVEEFELEDEVGGVNGQELFAKAEAFIGNFYKQLKMQREESWAS